MIARTIEVTAEFGNNLIEATAEIGNMSIDSDAVMSTNIHHYHSEYPEYDGEYEVTPSAQVQVLNTNNKVMLNNVTINPIPSNYGLITWNGTTLTVS